MAWIEGGRLKQQGRWVGRQWIETLSSWLDQNDNILYSSNVLNLCHEALCDHAASKSVATYQ
eukprot:scaffold224251_cov10-Prasinocladus_malaysianus.AAC.1